MEDWKITIAEGITSYSKSGKKNVKIVTKDNKTGEQVAQAMTNNMSKLCADFKGITKVNPNNTKWLAITEEILVPGIPTVTLANSAAGSGYKTFFIKTGSWQAQEQLINNIKKVLDEVSEYKNAAPVVVSEDTSKSGLSNNTILIIAVVLIVAALVWALWK